MTTDHKRIIKETIFIMYEYLDDLAAWTEPDVFSVHEERLNKHISKLEDILNDENTDEEEQ